MAMFVHALPTPTRIIPEDSQTRVAAERGEQLFASVGCAICHTPNLGLATGLYSDLLLHDMGYSSMDLNHADPYIQRVTPVSSISTDVNIRRTIESNSTGYYGGSSVMTQNESSRPDTSGSGQVLQSNGYQFNAPNQPLQTMEILDLGSESKDFKTVEEKTDDFEVQFLGGRQVGTVKTTVEKDVRVTRTDYLRIHIEPTNFNQEWRTPPLWGVRDSAPYMHDGRAETLLESISMHDGESAGTRDRFLNLSLTDRNAIIAFLNTLVAPSNVPQVGS
jgi:Di-haem oxidoreductase, putative peroxidase